MKKFAFLLLASALLTSTAAASGWGSRSCGPTCNTPTCAPVSCDPCGDSCRPGLLDRLRGLFHRNKCCEPQCDPCPAPKCHAVACPAPKCAPVCAPVCTPTCAPACDPCDRGPGLLERLRARFHRDRCNDPCCDPCAGGTVVMTPAKSGEVITTPPKKLPNPGKGQPKVKGAAVVVPPAQPFAPPAIRDIPTVPALDIDSRRPF